MQTRNINLFKPFVVLKEHENTNENDLRANEYRINDKKNEKVKMSTNGTTGKSR